MKNIHSHYFDNFSYRHKQLVWKNFRKEAGLTPRGAKVEQQRSQALMEEYEKSARETKKRREALQTELEGQLLLRLMGNPDKFNAELLSKISKNRKLMENVNIRAFLVRNKNTPLDIVLKHKNDKFDWVRAEVASNPNVPRKIKVELLRKLENTESFATLNAVAENMDTPVDVLERLTKDSNSFISRAAEATLKKVRRRVYHER